MNILILTGSYGGWHNAAANNLKLFYENKGDNVKIIDILDFINSFLAKTTKWFYKFSSEEYPKIWETFFNITDYPIVSRILYWIKDPVWQPKFNKIIDEFKPSKVISVFPFWNWWVKNYIKEFWHKFSWWIVVTDAINIQSFWYVREKYVDAYFVIDDYTKREFVNKFNYPDNKVVVSFFPFLENQFIDKTNISGENVLFLLTWVSENFADNFLSLTNKKITILKWRNNHLFEILKLKYHDKKNLRFIDFLPILENLDKYDLVIWKPWWALTCECIATCTPLLVPSFFPWQEEWNLKLLEKTQTWLYEPNPEKMNFLINYINWNKFLPNFDKVRKKDSIKIIDRILVME